MPNFKHIFALLSPLERIRALRVLAMMLVGVILETIGVGLVVPVLGLITSSPDNPSWAASMISRTTGIQESSQLAVAAMLALVGVYLIKNLFLSVQVWHQYTFSSGVQQQLSLRLYRRYLNRPYQFHLKQNSAGLIRNITADVAFVVNSINGVIQLTTEALVAVAILGLLLWFQPHAALFLTLLFLVAGGAFLAVSRKRVLRWGKSRQYHEGLRIQHLQQGLGGVKDVILLGCQDAIIRQFQEHNTGSAEATRMQNTFQQYPRLWLETISIAGLALLVAISVGRGTEIAEIVPILGIFAAAAFRMIPSANRILIAMQSIRFGAAAVEKIYTEMAHIEPFTPAVMTRADEKLSVQSIRFEHVSYRYEAASGDALSDICLQVNQGEVIGIIGASGSGKSTLIDLMLGLLPPEQGRILINEEDIRGVTHRWQSSVGYVPQAIYLMDDTLRRNIAFGRDESAVRDQAVEAAIDAAQLRDYVEGLPEGANTIVGERGVRLSGGQRQRIGIARALYSNPSVLVLDEATSALDTETEAAVMEAVNALKGHKTVIIVAHRLSTLSHCDRIYRMAAGKVVAEGPPALMLDASSLAVEQVSDKS